MIIVRLRPMSRLQIGRFRKSNLEAKTLDVSDILADVHTMPVRDIPSVHEAEEKKSRNPRVYLTRTLTFRF